MEKIILASSSKQRHEILSNLKIPFETVTADIEETFSDTLEKRQVSSYLSERKVRAVIQKISDRKDWNWVLGADTIVLHNDKIYGKPHNLTEAKRFLEEFSGKKHEVITGITLFNRLKNSFSTTLSCTEVKFSKLSEKEIEWYLDTNEWKNAAGAYRIQGLASFFIEETKGSYSNVVGLPIFELYCIFKQQGYFF